jgi:DUF917 family protein
MKALSEEELIDFIHGAAIYGTGGGGSISGAMRLLREARDMNLKFNLVHPDEVPDDAIIACPYGVGGGVQEEIRKRFSSLPRLSQREVVSMAVEALEAHLGREIYGFIPGELGAGNSFLAMYMAALTGKAIVDGDTVGRSVPEVVHSTFTLCSVPITPFVIATPFGDLMLVTRVLNDRRAEDIDRFMAVASGGGVTVIDHPITGERLRKSIILNSISKSIEVGRSIREAREGRISPIEPLLRSTGGYILFLGEIDEVVREDRDGFIWGNIRLRGSDKFKDQIYEIWFKNENLVTWLDGEPHVTCPDLVSVIDPETAQALSNWGDDLASGRRVAVIGIRAPDIWRTKAGLDILGPRYFGYNIEYRPIEEVIRGRQTP